MIMHMQKKCETFMYVLGWEILPNAAFLDSGLVRLLSFFKFATLIVRKTFNSEEDIRKCINDFITSKLFFRDRIYNLPIR